MARKYKRLFNMYPAWDYRRELEELNRQSEQGWQLIRGGVFVNRFKRNDHIRYRYQIDFSGKVEDLGRYIETFREQGWEYIRTTFNGWSYFRKPWDPSLPEEQYEIFTDQASLQEMTGRWIKLVGILTAIVAVFLAIYTVRLVLMPNLPALVRFLVFLLETAFLIYGILCMRKSARKQTFSGAGAIWIPIFALLIIGNIGAIYLETHHHRFTSHFIADEVVGIPDGMENVLEWSSIGILYTDNYYMDLNITADSSICFTLVDDSDTVIYTITDVNVDISNLKLHLEKGQYYIRLSSYEGGGLDVFCAIK